MKRRERVREGENREREGRGVAPFNWGLWIRQWRKGGGRRGAEA